MRNYILYALGAAAILLLVRDINLIAGFPDEAQQGAIFKIIFFHVPMAITAMTLSFVALLASVMFLVTKNFKYDALAVAVTEVGLAFLLGNLVTGSIWARIIWGVWWAWDVRLTSALVCWLLYAGYLMLRRAIEEPTQRATFAACFSIFAFIDVPIVYLSIRLFRTQHPGPVFFTSNGSFPPDWTAAIFGPLGTMMALMMLATIFTCVRLSQEDSRRELDSLRRMAHAM
jgi:heme exporter protein C